MAVSSLVLLEHWKPMDIVLVVAGTAAGIVFPVVPNNRDARSPLIWKFPIKFGSLHRTLIFDNSLHLSHNIADVSIEIEGGKVQLDHPFRWRGYNDLANLGIIPVVAWEVGRLDNTSPRRQIGAHSSASFAPANGFVESCRFVIQLNERKLRFIRLFQHQVC
jgi:hypothetical protein